MWRIMVKGAYITIHPETGFMVIDLQKNGLFRWYFNPSWFWCPRLSILNDKRTKKHDLSKSMYWPLSYIVTHLQSFTLLYSVNLSDWGLSHCYTVWISLIENQYLTLYAMARKDRDSVILPKDVEFSCMASFQKKQTDR